MCWDDVLHRRVTTGHAAALAANLPAGSCCLACEDERAGWTREELLLLALVNSLRDEKHQIDPFDHPDVTAFEVDDLVEYLARPRTAVASREG